MHVPSGQLKFAHHVPGRISIRRVDDDRTCRLARRQILRSNQTVTPILVRTCGWIEIVIQRNEAGGCHARSSPFDPVVRAPLTPNSEGHIDDRKRRFESLYAGIFVIEDQYFTSTHARNDKYGDVREQSAFRNPRSAISLYPSFNSFTSACTIFFPSPKSIPQLGRK